MKLLLVPFVLLIACLPTRAQLSDADLKSIEAQAQAIAQQLWSGESARSTRNDTPYNIPVKLVEGVANNLRKQAAKNAIKKSNSRMGRRMLGEDADLPAADLPFQAIQSARRGLLQSAVLPSPEDALAHSSLQQDTVLDGVALPDGSISTMDAGQCAASCYFRMDCISWTVNPSGQGAGCTLLGAGATASSSPGWTSGTINVDSQWQPPPYPVPPTPLESGAGKYANVLAQTRLFVEAQRSGQIQPGDPVSWRGNSNLQDPVVGGWYNGASTLKESFPIGTSVAFLAWGLLSFPDAYQAAGVYNDYVQTVRTGADYLANCWNDGNKSFVGQIGDTKTEVEYWGRPEDETGPRPAYIWTSDMHASDLLSSAVAALASTAQLINSSDSATASQYLATAQSIYAQATSNEGLYSDYFQDATAGTFPSSAFLDDQTWAAAWMYRATQDVKYLADADSFWQRSFGANRYNADVWAGWDSLWGPAAVLMRQNWRTGVKAMDVDQYTEFIATMFVPAWTKADGTLGVIKTPKGMAYPKWNSINNLQFPTTAAMVMLQDTLGNPNKKQAAQELNFARAQVNFALGAAGRSYVVGYGGTPPASPRNPAASCPAPPAPCDNQNYYERAVNPNVISGGLVGGPIGVVGNSTDPDYYVDVRTDWRTNEPTIDAVSGLAGAVAGLWHYTTK